MQYTTYYSLPQYEGSDKTAWLTIFNQAMLAIDTAIHAAKSEADSASTLAQTAQSAATRASSDVSNLTSSLNTVIGNINTINSLIGNGTPTTTDETIIGAINELHADQGNLSNLQTTDKSSLVAAINEIAGGGGGGGVASEVKRGTLTAGQTSIALTFTSQTISANTLVDVYTDTFGVNPSNVSINNQVITLTFAAQASDVVVAVKVEN